MTGRRASGGDSDARVDELRRQLRTLGYLDAGVDRFVLGPAQATRSPAAIALLASIRSGLVAGALLGPAAALGLGGRLPGLVTGMRDAMVIAVYLGILSGAAVTILSFVAALVVSAAARSAGTAFARRGRALSTGAGGLVSIGCLVYLTLWWRTANAGFGWGAPVWTAFALLVAVAISLLLGHVVTLTARAVMVARTPVDALTPRVPGASWKLAAAAGAAAFAGAAALLVLTAESPRPDATPPLTVRSSGVRVTVLAIDGFDPDLYEQIRPEAAGGGPLLSSIFDRARADLAPEDSRDPARLWTTIATGRHPEAHGVERLETRRVAGVQGVLGSDSIGRLLGGATDLLRLTRPAIASNVERRVKTFWEAAAQAGLRTGVVNWWATWPADASAGTVISDRAILRLEHGGALDAELAPPELYEQLRATWPTLQAEAKASAARFLSTDARDPAPLTPEVTAILTRSAELDAAVFELAGAIGAELDLLVIYLPGLDIAQHALLGDAPPAPSQVNDRLAALRLYYRYLDRLAGHSVGGTLPEDDRALFVVTQPGRLHRGRGILASRGGTSAEARTTATVRDVAPTILHALGVPVAVDLDGRVVDALFTPASLATYPVRRVGTYGLKGTVVRPRTGQPLDEEAIERLRSLGYVR